MLVFGARSMLAARTLEGLSPGAHCHVSLLGLVVATLIAIELGIEVRLLMAWHVSLVWKSHWDRIERLLRLRLVADDLRLAEFHMLEMLLRLTRLEHQRWLILALLHVHFLLRLRSSSLSRIL